MAFRLRERQLRDSLNNLVRRREALWAVAIGLAALTIAASWPGTAIGDNLRQLQEIRSGRLTDWHPPLMSVIWRALGATYPPMLILQASLYWIGLAALADALWRRTGSPKWAYAILLVGLTPMSLIYIGTVQKDTLLTSLFVLGIGLEARFGAAYGFIPKFLGMLTRVNAIFAFPPLVVRTKRPLLTIVLCALLSLVLFPVSTFVNRSILGAQPSHVERALQLFDLAGIEHYSGRSQTGRDLSRCYNPFYWDTLETDCGAFSRTDRDLTGPWLSAIATEPMAYLEHRIVHFDHNIFFLVPPLQECVYVPRHHPHCGAGGHQLLKDSLIRNAFLWPVTWLAVGMLLLFMRLDPLARALTLSGLFYGLGYFLVGVASGFRYFYWTEFAIQLAVVYQFATAGLPQWRRILLFVLAIWIIGYAYRFGPLVF